MQKNFYRLASMFHDTTCNKKHKIVVLHLLYFPSSSVHHKFLSLGCGIRFVPGRVRFGAAVLARPF